jgi:hypothetical protein
MGEYFVPIIAQTSLYIEDHEVAHCALSIDTSRREGAAFRRQGAWHIHELGCSLLGGSYQTRSAVDSDLVTSLSGANWTQGRPMQSTAGG